MSDKVTEAEVHVEFIRGKLNKAIENRIKMQKIEKKWSDELKVAEKKAHEVRIAEAGSMVDAFGLLEMEPEVLRQVLAEAAAKLVKPEVETEDGESHYNNEIDSAKE